MSMRYYAVNDYGMIIDRETAKEICLKLYDNYDGEADDYYYDVYNGGLCEYISGFTGDAFGIEDDGSTDYYSTENYQAEEICYLPLSNYPTLLKEAYGSIEEIIEELKNKLGKYLPDNFDYRSRIRHIVGVYYG